MAVDGVVWSRPQKLGGPLERRAGGPPGNTHHDLREGLQRGLELVGGRQGVGEVHGSGQDEQRRGDLLLQVQLQPLQWEVKTWTYLPALPHPHLRPGRARAQALCRLLYLVGGGGGEGAGQQPQQDLGGWSRVTASVPDSMPIGPLHEAPEDPELAPGGQASGSKH